MPYHVPITGDWVRVIGLRFFTHRRAFDSPRCLGIEFVTEDGTVKDYLPIEHGDPFTRAVVARSWCQMDGEQPPPETVAEALDRIGELRVREIEVRKEGRFWQVVSRRCYALLGPPVTYWEDGPPPPMWEETPTWQKAGDALPPIKAPRRFRQKGEHDPGSERRMGARAASIRRGQAARRRRA
jgi:hypothetical protein